MNLLLVRELTAYFVQVAAGLAAELVSPSLQAFLAGNGGEVCL